MTTQMGPFIEFLEQWFDPDYRDWFSRESRGKHLKSDREFREFAAGCLGATLSNMANDWQLVMKSYFELRVKHLKPA